MYCQRCGIQNIDNAYRCVHCGQELHIATLRPQTSGKAIASMVCSLIGFFSCFFILSIVGLCLGYGARNDIRASQGRLNGDGIASTGIVIGWISFIIGVVLAIIGLVIGAIAIAANA